MTKNSYISYGMEANLNFSHTGRERWRKNVLQHALCL